MSALQPTRTSVADTIPESTGIRPLRAVRILKATAAGLFEQASLHGELARVEWAEQRGRMTQMLVVVLLGLACLVCVMLAVGALVLATVWDSSYRIPAAIVLIALYGLGVAIAWRRFQALSALGDQDFAATREELAADVALLRRRQ